MMRRRRWWLSLILVALLGCNNRPWSSGDRVLVAKFLYDTDLQEPNVFDVVVFKYPRGPVENGTPKNYIKRLLGLPGQILALFFGNVFFWDPTPGDPPFFDDRKDPKIDPNDLWKDDFMHPNDDKSRALFEAGKFKILRKPPSIMMELRRIVYDNDFQAKNLGPEFFRWPSTGSWSTQDHKTFSAKDVPGDEVGWLRYQHLVPPDGRFGGPVKLRPELITDFMGYNSFVLHNGSDQTPGQSWVGDLMLECDLQVETPQGEFWMELSRGIDRFRARWDLANGQCTLYRIGQDGKQEKLADQNSSIKSAGNYQIRFANFDARLTIWVNGTLLFGDGVDYDPPELPNPAQDKLLDPIALAARRGPTKNDLEPASIGTKGAAKVQASHLRLWRDTYYTLDPRRADSHLAAADLAEPAAWDSLKRLDFKTLYVQPGHYLCLGDNSTASSDSRDWGLVPERLMLGRALLVYFPLNRAGPFA